MKKYDLTVMLGGDVPDAGQKQLESKIEKIVGALDGKVLKMTEMGKKQLAYRIGKYSEATYFGFEVELPAKAVVQLEKKVKVDQEILRHLLVVLDR